jgi:O-antigen/teichoic acid export membrane protein
MSLARNTAYNLVGYMIPTLLALVTVPAYLHLVGLPRYGVLAIAWVILGYFGLFDLGLGRATSHRIAELRDDTPHARLVALDTALVTNLVIGVIGGLILWPVAWYLFAHSVDMAPELRHEAIAAAPLLGLAVPVSTSIGVLTGALTGRERFLQANRISVASTSLFQILPLALAWYATPALPLLIGAAILARGIGMVMLWRACHREFGAVSGRLWDRAQLRRLLSYGGWVTLTAMFGPILIFADRFLIGAVISAAAVAIYVIPLEMMRRLAGVSGAMANALFPRLALASSAESLKLSAQSVGVLYAALTPVVAGAIFLISPAIRLWLGEEVGRQSAPLAQMFLVAYWINLFAQVPYTRLQAQGRPDLVGKIMLAETPVYVAAMWFALTAFGLWGAACTFAARSTIDTVIMFKVANRRVDHAATLFATLFAFTIASIVLTHVAPLSWWTSVALSLLAAAVSVLASYRIAPESARSALQGRTARWRRAKKRSRSSGV